MKNQDIAPESNTIAKRVRGAFAYVATGDRVGGWKYKKSQRTDLTGNPKSADMN